MKRADKSQSEFSVLGFYEESGQTFLHHVLAETPNAAFAVVANRHRDAVLIATLDGHIKEGAGVTFSGESLVDAEAVLEQPDVFGTPDMGSMI